jgi:acyl transferase domain-containing protein
MSVRAPGAKSLDEFWRNIRDGVESISFFTDEELLESGIDPAALRDGRYVKAAGVIDGPDLFDAPLFGMNPREAAITDPQQRLFLECAWEALEHAGCDPQRFGGSIGVFAGARTNSYLHAVIGDPASLDTVETLQANLGNEADFLATRVSYKLNLHGPAITVQTACSTSLVAVHVACQSLLCGECDAALAGGVAINTPQRIGYFYEEGGIVSPDGRCRAFDAGARGTVFGNGLGIVVLKRLVDALAQGDTIHAVIRGSAVNNDGAGKVGFTAPSVDGQARVIAEAIAVADVDPGSITYVETHGTGTALGDPIEIAALARAFGAAPERGRFCAIGSVKTNIGHLDTAAGAAGLIKTILALEHGFIPPSLHFTRPNPGIDFERSPFFVNTALRRWETSPRRAGVSATGTCSSSRRRAKRPWSVPRRGSPRISKPTAISTSATSATPCRSAGAS